MPNSPFQTRWTQVFCETIQTLTQDRDLWKAVSYNFILIAVTRHTECGWVMSVGVELFVFNRSATHLKLTIEMFWDSCLTNEISMAASRIGDEKELCLFFLTEEWDQGVGCYRLEYNLSRPVTILTGILAYHSFAFIGRTEPNQRNVFSQFSV